MSIGTAYGTVQMAYNSRNFVTKRTDGGVERRFYDPEGNMIKQVMPESYDKQVDDGAGYTYTYDTRGAYS